MTALWEHEVREGAVNWTFAASTSEDVIWHLQEMRRVRMATLRVSPWPGQQRRIELCCEVTRLLNEVLSMFIDLEVLGARERWALTDGGAVVPLVT